MTLHKVHRFFDLSGATSLSAWCLDIIFVFVIWLGLVPLHLTKSEKKKKKKDCLDFRAVMFFV